MRKAILGAAVIAFFSLFCTGLAVQSSETWRTPLLVFTGIGSVICAVGWLHEYRKDSRLARGDLFVTIRQFDYDNQGEFLWAKLAFYNGDSITRTLIDVKFTYRPNTDTEYILFDTETVSSGKPAGALGEVEILRDRWETIEYRSIAPKASNVWFKNIGTQAGLLITFTNASRYEDRAKIVGMEVFKAMVETPAYSFPLIPNISLDGIADSKQIEAFREEIVDARKPKGWAKYFGKRGCVGDY